MKSFAIIPAAGTSSRMGQPKLLLPWRGRAMIEHTIVAWQAAGVSEVIVIVRPDDSALEQVLLHAGAVAFVPPVAPPEMKDSVQFGLTYVAEHFSPGAADVWLLAPADMPQLSPRIVARLLAKHDPAQSQILVPTLVGRRGHPVLFPWPIAGEVEQLGPGEGINALTARHGCREVPCDDLEPLADAFADIDTPDEYLRGQPPK